MKWSTIQIISLFLTAFLLGVGLCHYIITHTMTVKVNEDTAYISIFSRTFEYDYNPCDRYGNIIKP